jgi:hypothetical protein
VAPCRSNRTLTGVSHGADPQHAHHLGGPREGEERGLAQRSELAREPAREHTLGDAGRGEGALREIRGHAAPVAELAVVEGDRPDGGLHPGGSRLVHLAGTAPEEDGQPHRNRGHEEGTPHQQKARPCPAQATRQSSSPSLDAILDAALPQHNALEARF